MTQAPAYKPTIRQFVKAPVLNSASNDFNNANGVRISVPTYIDLTVQQRKELLNEVRNKCNEMVSVAAPSTSQTGLQVESVTSKEADIEAYLGTTLEMLRAQLFQRGGLPVDLVLKLQSVTGIEYVSLKDMTSAFKNKEKAVKDWNTNYNYDAVQAAKTAQ